VSIPGQRSKGWLTPNDVLTVLEYRRPPAKSQENTLRNSHIFLIFISKNNLQLLGDPVKSPLNH
jgi:hypothetical protein